MRNSNLPNWFTEFKDIQDEFFDIRKYLKPRQGLNEKENYDNLEIRKEDTDEKRRNY